MPYENPFAKIYQTESYRKPYEHPLAQFPVIIDVEVTNYCNLDCLMCFRQVMKRKQGKMSFSIFKKIADESAKEGCRGIRFIRFGEPLLHERLFDMVAYAHKKGLLTHLTTNGLLLNGKKIKSIFDSGLDSVIFSLQGTTKKEYEFMRNNRQYDGLENSIKALVARRKDLNSSKPFIQVTTTVLDESEEQIKKFYDKWNAIVDRADHWYTSLEMLHGIDRAEQLMKRQRINEKMLEQEIKTGRKWRCNEIMVKLGIDWDGTVTACCGDFDQFLKVGHLKDSSIGEIWNGKKMNAYREILAKGERNRIPFCSKCCAKF